MQQVFHTTLLLTILAILVSCNSNNFTNQEHPEYFDRVFQQADSLKNLKKFKEVEFLIDSAFQNFPEAGIIDRWRKYHIMAQINNKYRMNWEKSLHYTDSMLFLLKDKEENYPREYFSTLFEKETAFIGMKDFNSAFEVFHLTKEFKNKNVDSCDLGSLYLRHGTVNFVQEKYNEAINYYRAGITQTNACKPKNNFYEDIIERQSIYNTIALAYEKVNKPDSAIYFYNEALSFLNRTEKIYPNEKNDFESARGVIYGNLGGTYAKIGENKKAEELLLESIRINKPGRPNDVDALTAMIKLSVLYLSQERIDEVETMIKNFEGVLNKATDLVWLRWYKLNWDFFEKKENIRQAYHYSTKYIRLKDTLDQRLADLRRVDFNIQTKNLEQKLLFENLNKENQKKNSFLMGGFVIMIMLAILLLIYLKSSRRMKTFIEKLKELNSSIAEKNADLGISLKSLEESQEENNKMLKMVAHDLRNPIGNIQLLSELILQDQKDEGEVKELAEMIKASTQTSLELINDLLLTNTKQAHLQKEKASLSKILQYCIDMLISSAEAKNQHLMLHAEQIEVFINREKIWRVFGNLINNAIKFSPENSEIHIHLNLINNKALVSIKDSGIGIPDKLKDIIFDMFTNAKRIGTSGEETFGLGLAISKQIVEAHEGRIWFESTENQGTTFFVELPLE